MIKALLHKLFASWKEVIPQRLKLSQFGHVKVIYKNSGKDDGYVVVTGGGYNASLPGGGQHLECMDPMSHKTFSILFSDIKKAVWIKDLSTADLRPNKQLVLEVYKAYLETGPHSNARIRIGYDVRSGDVLYVTSGSVLTAPTDPQYSTMQHTFDSCTFVAIDEFEVERHYTFYPRFGGRSILPDLGPLEDLSETAKTTRAVIDRAELLGRYAALQTKFTFRKGDLIHREDEDHDEVFIRYGDPDHVSMVLYPTGLVTGYRELEKYSMVLRAEQE